MDCLLGALEHAYRVLGFDQAAGSDEVFAGLVLARIIESASKLDSLRVLEEAGVAAASYRTVKRRLPVYAKGSYRREISAARAAHAGLGPASLPLARCALRKGSRAALRRGLTEERAAVGLGGDPGGQANRLPYVAAR